VPKERPNQPERRDDLVGVDMFALTVRRTLFSGLSFTALSCPWTVSSLIGLQLKTLTADFLWYPVSLVNSSSRARFSFFLPSGDRDCIPCLPPVFLLCLSPFEHSYCNLGNIFNLRHGLFSVTFFVAQRALYTSRTIFY
jgi:hypothetical protein